MFPTLYQISTRLLLGELATRLGRPATLDDVEDEALDLIAGRGFDWIWLMGVWQTGEIGRNVSATRADWRAGYREQLPDFTDADICGSPFAVKQYVVHAEFGGNDALARLRERIHKRGMRLMLDFVPNHTAIDHPWVTEHPEYYIEGSDFDLHHEPQNYIGVAGADWLRVFAYGRDPYFDGWPDTLQLNYRHGGMRAALIGELERIAMQCDGLRCDMAMLVLPNIFRRTWGERANPRDGSAPVDTPFWPEAIGRVRAVNADFTFLSEVYWDLEATLQLQGFDYTYDKLLYDRLRGRSVDAIREHLLAEEGYQRRSARFLENHDEPRAAAVFPDDVHQAAAIITFCVPGLRFFHDGQLDGRRIRPSIHLSRRAQETPAPILRDFYASLLRCLTRPEFEHGTWTLLDRRPAWDDNPTWQNFIAYQWRGPEDRRTWVVVNYGGTQAQCYLNLPDDSLRGRAFLLRDQMSRAWYERDGTELADRGLFLDMPAWTYHIFDVSETG